jgi:hypothetical protein
MEKRIAALSTNPHTVSLTDRKCSLFIDPKSGSIFVDEGDGEGRMNGVVFSRMNQPSFSVEPSAEQDHRLILNYCGIRYVVGVSDDGSQLRSWAESANSFLNCNGKQAGAGAVPAGGTGPGLAGGCGGESRSGGNRAGELAPPSVAEQ